MTDTMQTAEPARTSSGRGPRGWSGRLGPLYTTLAAVALTVAAVIFQLWLLPSPYPSDQINYVDSARDFPVPAEGMAVHQFTRYGLLLPIRLCIELFGYSTVSYFAVAMFAGVALVLAVFALGSLLFSRTVGLVAAVMVIANNVIVYDLMQPLPDLLSTALFTWAVVLAVALRQRRGAVTRTRLRRAIVLLAIGALLGWSYLAREYIVFAWPLIPLLLVRRVGWRGYLLLLAPLVLTGALELALNQWTYGDFLARERAVTGHGGGEIRPDLAATYQDKSRWWYLTRLPAGLAEGPEKYWLLGALAAFVAGGLVFWRRVGWLLVWAGLVYVPLVLLGGLLDPDAPKLRLQLTRYWFPVIPAIVIGGVAVGWLVARWLARRVPPLRRRAGVIAAVCVLAVGGTGLAMAAPGWQQQRGYRTLHTYQLSEFRGWLAAHSSEVDVLWTDARTVRILPLYFSGPAGGVNWSGRLRTMYPPESVQASVGVLPEPGEYVVLYSVKGRWPCDHCYRYTRKLFGDPLKVPSRWQQVFASSDGSLLVFRA
ncbi:hypothetical protein [Flindersiella endophytica]